MYFSLFFDFRAGLKHTATSPRETPTPAGAAQVDFRGGLKKSTSPQVAKEKPAEVNNASVDFKAGLKSSSGGIKDKQQVQPKAAEQVDFRGNLKKHPTAA